MDSAFGLNSPDFLQKKIERLKTALGEANVLMDRQVTERDEARAQLDALKRENEELKRQIVAGGSVATSESQPPVVDPALEAELRERIAELERDSLQARSPDVDPQLQERIDSLQRDLDGARRDLEDSRREADTSRRDSEAARRDADDARTAAAAAAQAAQVVPAVAGRRPPADT